MVCMFIPENSASAFSEKLNFTVAMQNTLERFSASGISKRMSSHQFVQKYKAGKNVTDIVTFDKVTDLTCCQI